MMNLPRDKEEDYYDSSAGTAGAAGAARAAGAGAGAEEYEHEEQGYDVVQGLIQEIQEMKTIIEEQVAQNENNISNLEQEIIKNEREIERNKREIAENHHYLKNQLSTLQNRVMMLERSGASGAGQNENDHQADYYDDVEESQGGGKGVRAFSLSRLEQFMRIPFINKADGNAEIDDPNSPNLDQTTTKLSLQLSLSLSSSSEQPFAFWSGGPQSLLYLSLAFRASFAVSYFLLYFDEKRAYGRYLKKTMIAESLCSTFLLLSVIFLLPSQLSFIRDILDPRYQHRKREMVGVVGWLIILAGAIAFVIGGRDSFYGVTDCRENRHDENGQDFTYSSCRNVILDNDNLRIAFLILLAGHTVELVHISFHALQLNAATRLKRILQILLVISPSCLAIAAYAVPVVRRASSIMTQAILLILHAFLQYVALFRITTSRQTSNQNTSEEDETQARRKKPEPIPDDMLDTFAFMITSNDAKVWNFGFLVFFVQAGLSSMILVDQMLLSNKTSILFDVPTLVPIFILFSQFWAILLSVLWQADILTSLRMLGMLWYERNENWPYVEIHAKNGKFLTWVDKVLLPNMLRLIEGVLVLLTSFVIIVKTDDVIDLFKDFTALILISEIDNVAFKLANQGYFGPRLKEETKKIKEIKLVHDSKFKVVPIVRIPVRLFVLLSIFAGMIGGWSYFIYGQTSRKFFMTENPKCEVGYPYRIGDGVCNGRHYNTEECDYDGGDCNGFNKNYPNCTVEHPEYIGDGGCDGGEYNVEECGYDGGDCKVKGYPDCHVDWPSEIGNGVCNLGPYYTKECGYDGGDDCTEFKEKYPDCNVEYPSETLNSGYCSGGEYNTKECEYDGGDCIQFNKDYPNCTVESPWRLGDGVCNLGQYNTEECGYDGGDDCTAFKKEYPNCNVDYPSSIGDGECDGEEYNTEECGYDGGDCL